MEEVRGVLLLFLFCSFSGAIAAELQGAKPQPEVLYSRPMVVPSAVPVNVPSIQPSPKPCREDGQRGQNIPLFETTKPLEVQLRYDAAEVRKAGRKKPNEEAKTRKMNAGLFIYKDGEKATVLPAFYYIRGVTRAWNSIYPLKIQIEEDTGIFKNSHKTLKIVTQGNAEWGLETASAQTTLAEYAIYQIMKASGVPAFDTRLMKTEYQTKEGQRIGESWAFVIEDSADMARRYGAVGVPNETITPTGTLVASRLGMLLTNSVLDHLHNHVYGRHNHAIIQRGGLSFDVPYDFDLNGFTHSAAVFMEGDPSANKMVLISKVEASTIQRYAGGDKEVSNTLALMISNKNKVYEALAKVPFDKSSPYPEKMKAWIDQFYAAADEFLKTTPADLDNLKVKSGVKPLLWFQMGCDEQKEKPVKLEAR